MAKSLPAYILILLLVTSAAQAQVEEGAQDNYYDQLYRNSFFTGGSLGFQFGSVIMVDVSPQIGYYPLEHIAIGAGFTYQYINNRLWSVKANVYGGRAFARLYLPVFSSVFAHLEYEYMAYHTDYFRQPGDLEWISLNNFLAGAGYRQTVGGRSSINLMVLWNFNESEYVISSNPIIRVGFDIGL